MSQDAGENRAAAGEQHNEPSARPDISRPDNPGEDRLKEDSLKKENSQTKNRLPEDSPDNNSLEYSVDDAGVRKQSQAQGEHPSGAPSGPAAGAAQPAAGKKRWRAVTKNARADSPAAPGQAETPAAQEAADMAAAAPDACARLFSGLAHIAPLVLLLLLGCMVWPDYWQAMRGEALYCPAEGKNILAYLHGAAGGAWLEPAGPAGPLWPGYTWFLAVLAPFAANILHMPVLLYPLAGSLGAFIALSGVWALAHMAGLGSRAAFAAGLILLCAPLFVPLGHFVGPAALACGLMFFSLAFFARGWSKKRAYLSMPLAFGCCVLAGLTGGFLFFAVPLCACFIYWLWRAKTWEGRRGDAWWGFVCMLIMLGAWLGAVILMGRNDLYLGVLFQNMLLSPWPLPEQWWLPFALACLGLLPWLLMPVCVSWLGVFARSGKTLAASRRDNASALIWISLFLCCACAFFVPEWSWSAVAMAGLCCPLFGKACLNLSRVGRGFFWALASICLFLGGLCVFALYFSFSQELLAQNLRFALSPAMSEAFLHMTGLPVAGGLAMCLAVLLFVITRRNRGGGELLLSGIIAVILTQPACLMLAPELGALPESRLSTLESILRQTGREAEPSLPGAPHQPDQSVQPAAPGHAPESAAEPAPGAAQESAPMQSGPAQSWPDNSWPDQSGPVQSEPVQSEPDQAMPGQPLPEKSRPEQTEQEQPEQEQGVPADITGSAPAGTMPDAPEAAVPPAPEDRALEVPGGRIISEENSGAESPESPEAVPAAPDGAPAQEESRI